MFFKISITCTLVSLSSAPVGSQDIRIVDERPRDGDALHLTAGHLVRLFVELVAKAHALKRPDRALAAL